MGLRILSDMATLYMSITVATLIKDKSSVIQQLWNTVSKLFWSPRDVNFQIGGSFISYEGLLAFLLTL